MAKANINSQLLLIPGENGERKFFSTSTVENQRYLRHTRIYEQISEEVYNQIKLDDVKDSQGDPRVSFKEGHNGKRTYIRLIKDGQLYSTYADEKLQKKLEAGGKNSFSNQLRDAGGDSILSYAKTNNFPAEAQKGSFWNKQQKSLENVAVQVNEFIGDVAEAIDDINLNFKGNRRKEYENLYYPQTIATSKQDRIVFSMRYISGSRDINFNFGNGKPLGIGARKSVDITSGSVTLPIPGGISDENKVKFDNDSLGVLGALGFGAALNPAAAVVAGTKLLGEALNSEPEDIRKALGGETGSNIIAGLRIRLAEMSMGRDGLSSRIGGGILNPNLELLFQAPELRSFRFSFTMSARSQPEATQIKKIIRFFKQGMSVKRSTDKIFIVSPNTFKISYQLGNTGKDHPSIGRIKECALTNLKTTYGNGSTYMTYDDPNRTLTTYKIDMTFTELEPITEDDYQEFSSGPLANSDEAFVKTGKNIPINHIGY